MRTGDRRQATGDRRRDNVLVLVPDLVVVLVLAPLASAHAASSPAGDIDSVLVFADRAKVTRARAVTCEKGTARATFDRLPAAQRADVQRGDVREAAEVIG